MTERPASSPARRAAPTFLIGSAIAVGLSAIGLVAMNNGTTSPIWCAGYLATAILWGRSWVIYRRARAQTGTRARPGAIVTAVLVGGLALGSAAAVGLQALNPDRPSKPSLGVGSCWADQDTQAKLVSCDSSSAAYTAVASVPTESDCPATAKATVPDDLVPGNVLCLAPM